MATGAAVGSRCLRVKAQGRGDTGFNRIRTPLAAGLAGPGGAAARRRRAVRAASVEGLVALLDSSHEQDRYIATAQLGITIASLGLGMFGEHGLADWLAPRLHWVGDYRVVTAHAMSSVVAVGAAVGVSVTVGVRDGVKVGVIVGVCVGVGVSVGVSDGVTVNDGVTQETRVAAASGLVLLFGIFYFLLIRPQQQRLKRHQQMIEAVKKGDMVVTSGGIVGKVAKVIKASKIRAE
mgnify:CR=1 FL=1